MHKKTVALVLVCLLTFLLAAQSIAYTSDYPDWPVQNVHYRSLSGDAVTVTGVAGIIASFLGYGTAATFTGIASAILSLFGTPWNIYI